MVIKNNFKIIEEGKTYAQIVQEEITKEEKQKVKEALSTFFTSVKILLKEGAVIIREGREEESPEEEFLQNPYLSGKNLSIYTLAINALPKQKAVNFASKVKGINLAEDYSFYFTMQEESEDKKFLEEVISKEVQSYIKDLPAIMEIRKEKLKLLAEIRPDIKIS